jgi:hypothetical protein
MIGGVVGIGTEVLDRSGPSRTSGVRQSMIPKSGNRFSEKIMLKQKA